MIRARLVIVTALIALSGCAHGALYGGAASDAPSSTGARQGKSERRGAPTPPAPDSITIGLWRFDENGGTHVADSGPFRLDGIAGLETRTDFGRFGHARGFGPNLDSFVYVPYSPAFEVLGGLTVEAWIRPTAYATYEDMPIAARWTPRAEDHGWLFSVVGRRLSPPTVDLPSPGYHRDLARPGSLGVLMFAFQPAEAGAERAFFSSRPIELDRWTHVAVTFDGELVRFYIDGMLDAQYATTGRIRATEAPLIVGNFLDPRWLTDFGGDLRTAQAPDPNPYYAFQGFIDELRISNRARAAFPGAELH